MLEARAEVLHAKAELRKKRHVLNWHNELRIGWGDQIFETLMWHNPTNIITTMPTEWRRTYHEEYKYRQHLWLEYQYFITHWFSAGGMMDLSEVGWTDVTRNGKGDIVAKSDRKYFYNVVATPTRISTRAWAPAYASIAERNSMPTKWTPMPVSQLTRPS